MILYFKARLFLDWFSAIIVSVSLHLAQTNLNLGFVWLDLANQVVFLTAVVGVSLSLLGFVLAASTFLVSHLQHERFYVVRGSKSWKQFVGITKSCLWRLLALALYAGLCIFCRPEYFKYMAIGLQISVVLTVISLIVLIWTVLSIISIPIQVDSRS